MGFVSKANIALGAASLASGQAPIMGVSRLIPFFGARKKGLTKAQRKKLLMRKRRRFVDTVIMQHGREHEKNRQLIINQTKAKLKKASSEGSGTRSRQNREKVADSRFQNKTKNKPAKAQPRELAKLKPKRSKVKEAARPENDRSKQKWTQRVGGRAQSPMRDSTRSSGRGGDGGSEGRSR